MDAVLRSYDDTKLQGLRFRFIGFRLSDSEVRRNGVGLFNLVAEWIHFAFFWDNCTHYKTESVHFWGLMNSATKLSFQVEGLRAENDMQVGLGEATCS